MSANTTHSEQGLEATAEAGIIAGLVAALPTFVIGMLASLIRDHGMFTPIYQLASPLDAGTYQQSLAQAGTGQPFYFVQEPFFFGFALSAAMAALFGLVFALSARALGFRGVAAVAAGLVYGLVVLAVVGWVLLPWAGSTLGSQPLETPASDTGIWALFAQYLSYGAVLGAWWSLRSAGKFASLGPGRSPEASRT